LLFSKENQNQVWCKKDRKGMERIRNIDFCLAGQGYSDVLGIEWHFLWPGHAAAGAEAAATDLEK